MRANFLSVLLKNMVREIDTTIGGYRCRKITLFDERFTFLPAEVGNVEVLSCQPNATLLQDRIHAGGRRSNGQVLLDVPCGLRPMATRREDPCRTQQEKMTNGKTV